MRSGSVEEAFRALREYVEGNHDMGEIDAL